MCFLYYLLGCFIKSLLIKRRDLIGSLFNLKIKKIIANVRGTYNVLAKHENIMVLGGDIIVANMKGDDFVVNLI